MVCKGIIQSIDYLENTCSVRLPIFESAGGGDMAVTTAIFSIIPGAANGYKENDVVIVAFENGHLEQPVVIGKLYTDINKEENKARGVFDIESLKVSKSATLPYDTKIEFNNNDIGYTNIDTGYNSLSDLINGIKKSQESISDVKVQLSSTNNTLDAKVNREGGNGAFGWELSDNNWKVYNTSASGLRKDVLTANADGLHIDGTLDVRDQSTIAGFTVGNRAIYTTYTDEGYDNGMSKLAKEIERVAVEGAESTKTAIIRSLLDPTDELPSDFNDNITSGVYIGADGIRVGNGFSISADGRMKTSGIKIDLTPEQINQLSFKITKNYASITAMVADRSRISAGSLVMISTDPTKEVNGYVFSRRADNSKGSAAPDGTKATGYDYVTDMEGISGIDAVSYWLSVSNEIHRGTKQPTNISVIAWKKIGSNIEVHDTDIKFKIKGISGISETKFLDEQNSALNDLVILRYESGLLYGFEILKSVFDITENDIIIEAYHLEGDGTREVLFDKETITYSPAETPVIVLSNDWAAISYNADGSAKLNEDEVVSTEARLVLNGEIKDSATCEWTLNGLIAASNNLTSKELTISEVTAELSGSASIIMHWTDDNDVAWDVGPIEFTVKKHLQGLSAITYWLNVSSEFHTGANQASDITVTALKKSGESEEEFDQNVLFRVGGLSGLPETDASFKLDDLPSIFSATEDGQGFIISKEVIANCTTNIVISAYHEQENDGYSLFDSETITYSPVNTAVIDLDNDMAAIAYDADGENKINENDIVISTAKVLQNGQEITDTISYIWELENLVETTGTSLDQNSISISSIATSSESGTAKVTATWTASNGHEFTAGPVTFTVIKQRQGQQGNSLYTWVAYADTIDPVDIFIEAVDTDGVKHKYIGYAYNKVSETDTELNPNAYAWTLLGGEQGVGVTSVVTQYHTSASATIAPDENSEDWTETIPSYDEAKPNYWSREVTTLSDGSITYSTPILAQSLNVDFLNTIGLTAKKISVETTRNILDTMVINNLMKTVMS